jgi:serine/threonine protein kinase
MSDEQPSGTSSSPEAVDDAATVIYPRTVPAQLSSVGPEQQLPVPTTDLGNHLPMGTFLGEFELTGLVGEGGFGIVYLAQDHSLQRRVALKEYMPSALAARGAQAQVAVKSERHRETFEAGLQSFVNEARLLAQFDHASLVKVYRFWEANGTAYMIMPFYEGATLKEWLQARRKQKNAEPPSEERLMALLDPLTEALQVIHAQQCYHRDIAPDNILLLKDGDRPLLLDFGAARRVIGDMTQALTVILKPGYAPIEQYAEVPGMKQGPWTDVYALAAVIYYAIVGKTPPTSVGRLVRDSHQALASIESVAARYSPRFLKAIDAALGVKPDERTQTIADLRRALGMEGTAAPSAHGHPLDFEISQQGGSLQPEVAALGSTSSPLLDGVNKGLPTKPDSPLADSPSVASASAGAAVKPPTLALPPPPHRRWMLWSSAGGMAALLAGGVWWGGLLPISPVLPKPVPDQTRAGLASGAGASQAAVAASASLLLPSPPNSAASASAIALPSTEPAATTSPPALATQKTPLADTDWNPLREFQNVVAQQTPGFNVQAAPVKSRLRIQRDKLALSVTPNQDGFVYVFLFGTDGKLIRIYPAGSFANRIRAAQTMTIPPQSSHKQIDLTVTGPAGLDQILVLVSKYPRRFNKAGMQNEGDFGSFPKNTFLKALQNHTGTQAILAGEVECAQKNNCNDEYGAVVFEVEEVRS